jgi:hypothetical protein
MTRCAGLYSAFGIVPTLKEDKLITSWDLTPSIVSHLEVFPSPIMVDPAV